MHSHIQHGPGKLVQGIAATHLLRSKVQGHAWAILQDLLTFPHVSCCCQRASNQVFQQLQHTHDTSTVATSSTTHTPFIHASPPHCSSTYVA